MQKQMNDRKLVARKRIRGLLILLIVIMSFVLIYDIYLFVESGF